MLDDTFTIVAYTEPDPRELITALGPRARVFVIDAEEGRPAVLYQDLSSTRGVELAWESDQVQVRLLPFCSAEDQAIALDVLALLRRRAETPVANGGELFDDDDALAARVRAVADALAAHVIEDLGARFDADDDRTWIFQGPVRPFFLGPRLWAALRAQACGEALATRMVERLRRVQYADRDVSVSVARRREVVPEEGAALRVAALAPGGRCFVPSCELVGVLDVDGAERLLPPSVLAALLGASCEALDERQLLVEALRGPRREAFLRHVRALTAPPADGAPAQADLAAWIEQARPLGEQLALVEQGSAEPGDRRADAEALTAEIGRLEALRKDGGLDDDGHGTLEDAYRDLSILAFEAERHEEELTALERRLNVVAGRVRSGAVHPTRLAAAHTAVAGAEERCGRPNDALHHLDLALRILGSAPGDGSGVTANHLLRARVRRAELLAQLGRHEEARAELEVAVAAVPTGALAQHVARAYLALADVRARLGSERLSILAALERAVGALGPAVARGEELELFVGLVGELEAYADDAGVLPLIAEATAPALALLEAGRAPASALLSLVVSRAKALWGSGDVVRGLTELERGRAAAATGELTLRARCETEFALADLLRARDELERARVVIDDLIAMAEADEEARPIVPFLRVNRLLTCLAQADVEGADEERQVICRVEGRATTGGLMFGSLALTDTGRPADALVALEKASALLGDDDTMRGEGLRAELRLARARARLAADDRVGAGVDASAAFAVFDAHLGRGIHLGELPRLEALVVLGAAGDPGALERAVADGERASERLPRALDLAVEASLWLAARGARGSLDARLDRALARPAGAARSLLALQRLTSVGDATHVDEVLGQALARLAPVIDRAPVTLARWRSLRAHLATRPVTSWVEEIDRRLGPSGAAPPVA